MLRQLTIRDFVIVDRLDVRWPNGRAEHWERLAGDRLHTLVEGAGR